MVEFMGGWSLQYASAPRWALVGYVRFLLDHEAEGNEPPMGYSGSRTKRQIFTTSKVRNGR